jgi:hypothetical protein
MLLDIATEELSHLEMVAQTLSLLLKGSPSELVDQVEGNYLGELLDGNMPGYMAMAVNSGPNVLGGGGPRLTDSMGAPWTAAYIDTIGQPVAPHRPFGDPQVARDLINRVAAGEPPGGLQPQLLTPLLLGGRVPAPLRIPHASVIRPQPADVTT